MNDICFVVLNN